MSDYCFECEAVPGFLGFRGSLARDLLALFHGVNKKGFLIQMGNSHYKMEPPSAVSICSETRVWALNATFLGSWFLIGLIMDLRVRTFMLVVGAFVVVMVVIALGPKINHLFATSMLPELVDPRLIRFSQNSIRSRFHDGSLVTGPPRSEQPQIAVVAIQHEGNPYTELFAVNNRTLFNAAYNGIDRLRVILIDKPSNWASRFTCTGGGICITVCADLPQQQFDAYQDVLVEPLVSIPLQQQFDEYLDALHEPLVTIPASSLNPYEARGICFVVLEVRDLVKPQRPETLFSILRAFSADINIQEVEGERSYARIHVDNQDTELITNIKAIGKQRGKKVVVREVGDLSPYDSPRD